MSAVITNIYDLEFVWRADADGFAAGVDFKTWLANTVIQQRADLQAAQERIAEQARQLDEARKVIERCSAYIGSIDHGENTKPYRMCDAWLAANPAPQNNGHVHLSAGGKCVICGLPAPQEPQP